MCTTYLLVVNQYNTMTFEGGNVLNIEQILGEMKGTTWEKQHVSVGPQQLYRSLETEALLTPPPSSCGMGEHTSPPDQSRNMFL